MCCYDDDYFPLLVERKGHHTLFIPLAFPRSALLKKPWCGVTLEWLWEGAALLVVCLDSGRTRPLHLRVLCFRSDVANWCCTKTCFLCIYPLSRTWSQLSFVNFSLAIRPINTRIVQQLNIAIKTGKTWLKYGCQFFWCQTYWYAYCKRSKRSWSHVTSSCQK